MRFGMIPRNDARVYFSALRRSRSTWAFFQYFAILCVVAMCAYVVLAAILSAHQSPRNLITAAVVGILGGVFAYAAAIQAWRLVRNFRERNAITAEGVFAIGILSNRVINWRDVRLVYARRQLLTRRFEFVIGYDGPLRTRQYVTVSSEHGVSFATADRVISSLESDLGSQFPSATFVGP